MKFLPGDSQVYKAIVEYKIGHFGDTPSLEAIATAVGKSKSTTLYAIRRLEAAGHLVVDHEVGHKMEIRVAGGVWLPPQDIPFDVILGNEKKKNTRRERSLENCLNCARPLSVDSFPKRGLCGACYAYRQTNGRSRPDKLLKKKWCACGQQATTVMQTPHGDIHVCEDCLSLEKS